MATFTGTSNNDTITTTEVSAGVTPGDSLPSDAVDTLLGASGDDILAAGGGDDLINAGGGDDSLGGGDGIDRLLGGGGNDILNGGAAGDEMRGGAGDDIYFVSSRSDDVGEAFDDETSGTDTVRATLSYDLGFAIENLVLSGTDDIDGTGNEKNNDILGNAGSNVLDGRAGNDRLDGGAGVDLLIGGTGNDRYILDNVGDTVFERTNDAAGGTDTVVSSVTVRLGFGLENLVLRGTAGIDGTGNGNANRIEGNGAGNVISGLSGADALLGGGGADRIFGNGGDDRVVGGGGLDRVSGGSGDDRFVFNGRGQAGDVITDFRNNANNDDAFVIDASAFGGGLDAGTTLDSSRFQIRADNQAQDGNDRFIFRTTDDTLWFDRNGSADGGRTLVADLDAGATVTSGDIFLV